MSNRVDETTEHIINVVVITTLLIDEMDSLEETPIWNREVKRLGKLFLKELEKSNDNILNIVNNSAAGMQFLELCQDYSHMFDNIRNMSAKDRLVLAGHIEDKFKQNG